MRPISAAFPYHQRQVALHMPCVGVGCLIFSADHGGFLIGRRSGAHGQGQFSVPGGWLEHGETSSACARREAREEVDLDLEFDPPIGTSECVVEGLCCVTLFVPTVIPAESWPVPQVMEPDKFVDLRWVSWRKLPELSLFLPLGAFRYCHPTPPFPG